MIHVHGTPATLEQLEKVPVIRPTKAGSFWKGVQFGEVVHTIQNEIEDRGWNIKESKFNLSPKQDSLVGAFDLDLGGQLNPISGVDYAVAFSADNSMKKAFSMRAGATVEICTNGLETGDLMGKGKHTKKVNLAERIKGYFDKYLDKARGVTDLISGLRTSQLTDDQARQLIMEVSEQGFLPSARILCAWQEYKKPSHEEHGTGTRWTLMNSLTEMVKLSPTHSQPVQLAGFRNILTAGTILESNNE